MKFIRRIKTSVTVYEGEERDGGCDDAVEKVMVVPNTDVTFCVSVMNNGKQPLVDVNVTSPVLGLDLGEVEIPSLDVRETKYFTFPAFVGEKAIVTPQTKSEGNPVFFNGNDIWTLKDVTSTDAATAEAWNPSVEISNKVSSTSSCQNAEDTASVYEGSSALYCFTITNTGNSFLSGISVQVPGLGDYTTDIPRLAPSKSTVVELPWPVVGEDVIYTTATVVGTPNDGTNVIAELEQVTARDDSTVTRLTIAPTTSPSAHPSLSPSVTPSVSPTASPSTTPTVTPTLSPSAHPSLSPSMAPSATPTAAPSTTPTSAPSKAPTPIPVPVETTTRSGNKGGGGGDPHFKTWLASHKFDYHGECDLVLAHVPLFADGLGLRVHIRTKRQQFFSYIERVAVQIGSDVLEFAGRKQVYINGEHHENPTSFAGYSMNTFPRALSIRLNETAKAKIDFIDRKNGMPYVVVDAGETTDMFAGSKGLMGLWPSGDMVGRNGTNVADLQEGNYDLYAEGWQVQDNEPLLFQTARAPQFPQACVRPVHVLGNRLGDSHMKAAAEQQCSAWKEDKEDCIFDVMAMRDLSAAEDPVALAY